jgi:hypothetical protein
VPADHPYASLSRLSKTHHGDKDSRDSRRSLPPWFLGTSQKKSSPSTKQRRPTSVGIEGPRGIIIEDKNNSTDEAPAPVMVPHIVAAVNKVDIDEKNQNKDKVPKVRSCNVALTNVQCSD